MIRNNALCQGEYRIGKLLSPQPGPHNPPQGRILKERAPSLTVFPISQQIEAGVFRGHRQTHFSLYQFVREDITMDTDKDPRGKSQRCRGQSTWEGARRFHTSGDADRQAPRVPACLAALQTLPFLQHTTVADYTTGLSGDQFGLSLSESCRPRSHQVFLVISP